jgi:uncharacterized repeat protein (TIGR03803 family)
MSRVTDHVRPATTRGQTKRRAVCCIVTGLLVGASSAAECATAARGALTPEAPHQRSGQVLLRVLHAFFGGKDGALPAAGLMVDTSGALYGTTQAGGAKNMGTTFKLAPSGSGYLESVLYAFQGGKRDGAFPLAALITDASGALYGTTSGGGDQNPSGGCSGATKIQGCGTVFKLAPSGTGYREKILYEFLGNGVGDGVWPYAGLTAAKAGALYGTTFDGGEGLGNVFALTPSGTGYKESEVFSFPFSSSGSVFPEGVAPQATLLIDRSGALYGTKSFGGTCSFQPITGCGVAFKLTPTGSGYAFSLLYAFQAGKDGLGPVAGLIADKSGALYGTTEYGGPSNAGTVFKLTPSGSGYTESVVYAFQGGNDGALPVAGLVAGKRGLYGTTAAGGSANLGTIFALTPSGSGYAESILYAFQGGSDGSEPVAALIAGKTGVFYGTAQTGGAYGVGTVFALNTRSER